MAYFSHLAVLSSRALFRLKLRGCAHTRIAPIGQGQDALPGDEKGKRLEETGRRGGDQFAERPW